MKHSPIDHARPKRWKYDDFFAQKQFVPGYGSRPWFVIARRSSPSPLHRSSQRQLTPAELRLRIAEYLRDEIATIEQEIATDQREVYDDA